jgi:hypothetical protein
MKQGTGQGIHDELSKTYFRAPNKKHDNKKWSDRARLMPWIVMALVVALAGFIVFSRSSIDIKVRLLGEVPKFSVSGDAAAFEKGDFLVRGGKPRKDAVKNAYFAGDGKSYSTAKDEELTLCNGRGAGWANYTIELKEPADLSRLDLKYTARGARGGEVLALVIVDGNNRIYRMEKDLSSSVTPEWQQYTVNFRPVKNALDLSDIKTIKFEFGSLTAENYSGAVILLKDIYLTKAKRFKWL